MLRRSPRAGSTVFDLPALAKVADGLQPTRAAIRGRAFAYSPRSPARQPISQKSVSSRVASLKIVTSSASRAGVT